MLTTGEGLGRARTAADYVGVKKSQPRVHGWVFDVSGYG
jgi:hypothetical protein